MSLDEIIASVVAKELEKNTDNVVNELKILLSDVINKLNKVERYSMQSYVTEQVASDITGWSLPTLRKWRYLKKGPTYYKTDKSIRYKVEDLVSYMEHSKITTFG